MDAEHEERSGTPVSRREILEAFLRPHRALEYVLEAPTRLHAALQGDRNQWLLCGLLAVAGVVFALPYGAIPPVRGIHKIALLFTGSVLICWPSLHVFGTYLGARVSPSQGLALALLLSAVAGAFTLGFFPIVLFLDLTSEPGEETTIGTGAVSVVLLGVSLSLAIVQMLQVLVRQAPVRDDGRLWLLLSIWLALLVFITFRMARSLGILG
jgi:hypothetical protein